MPEPHNLHVFVTSHKVDSRSRDLVEPGRVITSRRRMESASACHNVTHNLVGYVVEPIGTLLEVMQKARAFPHLSVLGEALARLKPVSAFLYGPVRL